MPETLLAAKLHIARLRQDLVHRPQLIERLDAGLRKKMTLVSAPAGIRTLNLLLLKVIFLIPINSTRTKIS